MTLEDLDKGFYSGDRPVKSQFEDKFQRYPFAKQIADTIANKESKGSIVFGLFGAWGEGKSSVLNFIDQELESHYDIIKVNFNPWRYSDEDSLLRNFFSKIAEALGKELKKNTEKIGDFLSKYGKLANVFGYDASSAGSMFSDVGIEQLKTRVDEFLNQTESRIVIFVDDIDRLDKQEIYSLFRLVKLTADFSNTTYILSFDEAMVAAAIGERFGAGDSDSGTNFLEKIIQVPLVIPKAQPEALKKFCFELVEKAIKASDVTLSEEEVQRFVFQFSTNILPRLNTPRLAVRYGNTLSFAMPMLKGEANTVDLMLIEAIKIFYPKYYQFIKENPEYFVGPYSDDIFDAGKRKSAEISEHLKKLSVSYNDTERYKIKDLLANLFPNLDTHFSNQHFSDTDKNKWYVGKRIVASEYFNRYFSYVVIEGDISDVEFERLLERVAENEVETIGKEMEAIIHKSTPGNFIQKLRSRETEFSWQHGVKIAKALCLVTDELPDDGGMLGFSFTTTRGQACIFIYQLLKNHREEEIFEIAKELMLFPMDIDFAYNLNNWFRSGDRPEDKLFNKEQYIELALLLTERAVEEAGDDGIFMRFPIDQIHYIIMTWYERDTESFNKYVLNYLDKEKGNILILLKSLVPVQSSSLRNGVYKTNITKSQYEYIISYFDKDDLRRRILENYSMEEIQTQKPYWIDMTSNEFSELNMVRQYMHWFDNQVHR